MRLEDILFGQGFGTRRACLALVREGAVRVGGITLDDPGAELDADGLHFEVAGVVWEVHACAYLMMNKPPQTECSQRPSAWASVYSLLPAPLRARPRTGGTGVQAVGRLDQDTTGLLLLSDDGQFIHRMTSPRRHVAKVYEVLVAEPLTATQIDRLRDGVQLEGEARPVRAAAVGQDGPRQLRLTLTEGRYHQVKRMVAAAGNAVTGLHRSAIGGLRLPPGLAPGQWRWLDAEEVAACQQRWESAPEGVPHPGEPPVSAGTASVP